MIFSATLLTSAMFLRFAYFLALSNAVAMLVRQKLFFGSLADDLFRYALWNFVIMVEDHIEGTTTLS